MTTLEELEAPLALALERLALPEFEALRRFVIVADSVTGAFVQFVPVHEGHFTPGRVTLDLPLPQFDGPALAFFHQLPRMPPRTTARIRLNMLIGAVTLRVPLGAAVGSSTCGEVTAVQVPRLSPQEAATLARRVLLEVHGLPPTADLAIIEEATEATS